MKNINSDDFVKDNIDYSKIYSPSKIDVFNKCPHNYYCNYVDPIKKGMKNRLKKLPANIWSFNTVGKAVHNAIVLFYYLPVEERTERNLLLQLRNTWLSEAMPNKNMPLGKWGGFESIEKERECYKEAQDMLRNFAKIYDKDPEIIFLPIKDLKRSIEDYKSLITKLNDDYDISGKFDLVIKSKNCLHVIDFKTGKSEEKDNFQLRFYKLLAEEKFNIPVEWVSFYYLRSGKKIGFDMKDVTNEEIKKDILERIQSINSTTDFETKPSKLCKYCLFKTFCPNKVEVDKIIQTTKDDDCPDDLPF